MDDKTELARQLAEAHRSYDPSIVGVYRIHTATDGHSNGPIKLLEISELTPASGIVPIVFGATKSIPYPTVVVEITPGEFELLKRNQLALPNGWTVGEALLGPLEGIAGGEP